MLESLFSAQFDLAQVFSDERCESLQKRVCVTHTPGATHSFRIQVPCSATPASRSVLISLFAGPDPRTSCCLVQAKDPKPVCRRRIRSPLQARGFGGGAPEMIQIQLNAGNQAFRAGFAGWFRACWLVQSLLFSRCRPDCSLSLPTRPCFSVQVDALEFALLGSAISEPNA